MTVYQTNSTFEKTIEPVKTFNKENKEGGIFLALSNFDISTSGKFIIELQVSIFLSCSFLMSIID